MVHPEKLTVASLVWWVEKVLKIPVNKYSPKEWLTKVENNPALNKYFLLYEKYMEITNDFTLPVPEVSSNYTSRCMAKYGIYWPSPFESFEKFLPNVMYNKDKEMRALNKEL